LDKIKSSSQKSTTTIKDSIKTKLDKRINRGDNIQDIIEDFEDMLDKETITN